MKLSNDAIDTSAILHSHVPLWHPVGREVKMVTAVEVDKNVTTFMSQTVLKLIDVFLEKLHAYTSAIDYYSKTKQPEDLLAARQIRFELDELAICIRRLRSIDQPLMPAAILAWGGGGGGFSGGGASGGW